MKHFLLTILLVGLPNLTSADTRLAVGFNLPLGAGIELGNVTEEKDYWLVSYARSDILIDVKFLEIGWMTPVGSEQKKLLGLSLGQIEVEDDDDFLGIFEVEGVREEVLILKFAHYYSGLDEDSGRFGINWFFGPEGTALAFDFSYRFDL